jgi:hypothetical protein
LEIPILETSADHFDRLGYRLPEYEDEKGQE